MYSLGAALSPFLKNLMVGYPRTPNCCASSDSSVASTLASRISEPSAFSFAAAFAYSGASALQCPHHGASAGRDRASAPDGAVPVPLPPQARGAPLLVPGQGRGQRGARTPGPAEPPSQPIP